VKVDIYRKVTETKLNFFRHACRMNNKRFDTDTGAFGVTETGPNEPGMYTGWPKKLAHFLYAL